MSKKFEGPEGWREIVEAGWGSYFCAGAILSMIRLYQSDMGYPETVHQDDVVTVTKQAVREDLIAQSKWYYCQLIEMVSLRWEGAYYTLQHLQKTLGPEGLLLIRQGEPNASR